MFILRCISLQDARFDVCRRTFGAPDAIFPSAVKRRERAALRDVDPFGMQQAALCMAKRFFALRRRFFRRTGVRGLRAGVPLQHLRYRF